MTRKDYKEFAELIKASVNNPEIFTITDVAYGTVSYTHLTLPTKRIV